MEKELAAYWRVLLECRRKLKETKIKIVEKEELLASIQFEIERISKVLDDNMMGFEETELQLYKVFVTQVENSKNIGTAILCENFSSVELAKNAGSSNLLFSESYFEIRGYEATQNNIIGGENDTGTSLGIYQSKDLKTLRLQRKGGR